MHGIGIDIGGTGIKAGRIRQGGEPEAAVERPTPAQEGPERLVPIVVAMIRELEADLPASDRPPPLGVGCAGLVDPITGVVHTSPNLPAWKEAPLADLIASALGRRPLVLNDANAFTLAEARRGAGHGARSVVGVTMGTGVGGGLLLDDRLWQGRHGYAGELGHMPLVAGGPLCACGSRGCLEAMVGTLAIQERYRRLSGGTALFTPEEISRRARSGDAPALETWRETGHYLGLALGGLANLLDPELFVIGGGIAGSADLMFPSTRAAMAATALLPESDLPELTAAALGSSAGWIGAALAALDAHGL